MPNPIHARLEAVIARAYADQPQIEPSLIEEICHIIRAVADPPNKGDARVTVETPRHYDAPPKPKTRGEVVADDLMKEVFTQSPNGGRSSVWALTKHELAIVIDAEILAARKDEREQIASFVEKVMGTDWLSREICPRISE